MPVLTDRPSGRFRSRSRPALRLWNVRSFSAILLVMKSLINLINRHAAPRQAVLLLCTLFVLQTLCTACGTDNSSRSMTADPNAAPGTRDNTPEVLVPAAPGTKVLSQNGAEIDYSNSAEGYVGVRYSGSAAKVKLQVTCPDDVVYTYTLTPDSGNYDFFPLSSGDGSYKVAVYTLIRDKLYATACSLALDVALADPYRPYLYPNQYVWFTSGTEAVAKAEEICAPANTDLDTVSIVYNYVSDTIGYDKEEADTVKSGYVPDVDAVLKRKKGICFDYCSLMAAMLRSQRIPTRLEIGYAGTAYHAWISVYLSNIGWVDGIIRFDGQTWSLMDPTLASTTGTTTLKKFIGDGSNYQTKFIY